MKLTAPILSFTYMFALAAAWVKTYPNKMEPGMSADQIRTVSKKLNKGMRGFGTDEGALINNFGDKKLPDRIAIAAQYQRDYRKTLESAFNGEVKGDFGRLLRLLSLPAPDAEAAMLFKSFELLGTNELHLMQIVLGRENSELKRLNGIYQHRQKKSLKDAIKQDTSGLFQEILVSCSSGDQEIFDFSVHNETRVQEDVDKFQKATVDFHTGLVRGGTDEGYLIRILCKSPAQHLIAVHVAYHAKHGKWMADVIKDETDGKFKRALLLQLNMQLKPADTIFEQFKATMSGGNTDKIGLFNLMVRYQPTLISLFDKNDGGFSQNKIDKALRGFMNKKTLLGKLVMRVIVGGGRTPFQIEDINKVKKIEEEETKEEIVEETEEENKDKVSNNKIPKQIRKLMF